MCKSANTESISGEPIALHSQQGSILSEVLAEFTAAHQLLGTAVDLMDAKARREFIARANEEADLVSESDPARHEAGSRALEKLEAVAALSTGHSTSYTTAVQFGTRLFEFSIGSEEIQHMAGHALELARGASAMQRLVGLYLPNDTELADRDAGDIQVGLQFLCGMVAELLAAAEGA